LKKFLLKIIKNPDENNDFIKSIQLVELLDNKTIDDSISSIEENDEVKEDLDQKNESEEIIDINVNNKNEILEDGNEETKNEKLMNDHIEIIEKSSE
jgi:hypothetical protein